MTVAELIEALQSLPQHSLVLVDAYEDGQDSPTFVGPVVAGPVKPTNYTGSWEIALSHQDMEEKRQFRLYAAHRPPVVPAVWITCRDK